MKEQAMDDSPAAVLDRVRVREVTGVFNSERALQQAVDDLLLSGFDRGDIDRVATLDEITETLGAAYVASEELADIPQAPRKPFFSTDDISAATAVVASVVASAAGLAAAFAVAASGVESIWGILGAAIAGAAVGGIAALLVGQRLAPERSEGLQPLMESRGLILWVRVRSPDREQKAVQILQEDGAHAVRVHEIEIAKTPDEIPLSNLRPDPWLGEERLGQP
jgi:hypothetical protein